MKKEWKNIQTSVFQNHFSETNWKRSIEEKAAVTFSMKGNSPTRLRFFFGRMNVSWPVLCWRPDIPGNTDDTRINNSISSKPSSRIRSILNYYWVLQNLPTNIKHDVFVKTQVHHTYSIKFIHPSYKENMSLLLFIFGYLHRILPISAYYVIGNTRIRE